MKKNIKKVILTKVILIMLIFSKTSFSQFNFETADIPQSSTSELQNLINKLLEIKKSLEEMEGIHNIYSVKQRSMLWTGKAPIELRIYAYEQEKNIQRIAKTVIKYNLEFTELKNLLLREYSKVPLWINKFDLPSYTKEKELYLIPEEIPIDINNLMIDIIHAKIKIELLSGTYQIYSTKLKIAKIKKNNEKIIYYQSLIEDNNKEKEIWDKKFNKLEKAINEKINKTYGEMPRWFKNFKKIKELEEAYETSIEEDIKEMNQKN